MATLSQAFDIKDVKGRCRDYSARKYSDMMSGEAPSSVLREKRSGKEIVRALRKLRGKPVTNMSEVRVLAGEPLLLFQ